VTLPIDSVLTAELLARIHDRAPGYDRDNAFFTEDLAELAHAGYLRSLVPRDLGGLGLSLQQMAHEQVRLAKAAPATALAVNMHLVWTGVAKALHDRGDDSLDFVLRDAAAGEIYAFAISEAGNDLVLFDSTTDARPLPDGGYAFTGTKIFTSLSPAWTRLGLFGLDTVSADAPKLVHAVVTRQTPGITIAEDWNTLGMRASQSNTTHLDSVAATSDRVFRRLDPGPSRDALIFAIFANFEILISAVYVGIGERALELAVESAHARGSRRTGLAGRSRTPPSPRTRCVRSSTRWPQTSMTASIAAHGGSATSSDSSPGRPGRPATLSTKPSLSRAAPHSRRQVNSPGCTGMCSREGSTRATKTRCTPRSRPHCSARSTSERTENCPRAPARKRQPFPSRCPLTIRPGRGSGSDEAVSPTLNP
jgi:alkylation response protein AidB-like acyl-CoA dehydrogenase